MQGAVQEAVVQSATITGLTVRAVDVPMKRPIQTASGTVASAPLMLLDLTTDRQVTGSAYVFAFSPAAVKPLAQLAANLAPLVVGEALAPAALHQKLNARFRLLGVQGLVAMALAAVDMAAWDALARVAGLPLSGLLGGGPARIPAYASLASMAPEEVAREAAEMAGQGMKAVKVRLGLSDLAHDLAVVAAVRKAVGDGVALMADYNQSLSVAEAVRRCRALDGQGLSWIEEPVRFDDVQGHATVADAAETPIQTGENWWGPYDMERSLAGRGSDLVMIDVVKIGGVTGWLRAAALADAAGKPVSSHLFGEYSAHLLSVTPTRHLFEYLDLAGPILKQPVRLSDGMVEVPAGPGAGIDWDEEAVGRYLLA